MNSLLVTIAAVSSALHCGFVQHGEVKIEFPATLSKDLRYFSVVNKGRWYSVVDEKHSFVDYRPGMPTLTFKLSEVKAVEYRDGKAVILPMFQHNGSYKLVFSDSIDTEPSEMASVTCSIFVK